MARSITYATVTGTILADTGKAIKFQIDKIHGEDLPAPVTEWIPVSQISKMFKDPNETGNDWANVAEWILKNKGLITEDKVAQEQTK